MKVGSLSTMILELMNQQKSSLANRPRSSLDDLMYCDFLPATTMELQCRRCSKPSHTDTQPRWSVNRPDHHVAIFSPCRSEQCKGKKAWHIPKDKNIRWTWAETPSLKASHTFKALRSWKGLLISDPKQLEHLPCPMLCQCIHDGRRYVDTSPQWGPGDPPKYIEKRSNCHTCILQGRHKKPRYIPADKSIPSITTRALTNFYKKWEKQPEDLVRTIFALEPGQPRKPRVSQRSGTTKPMKKRSSEEAQSDSAEKMLKKAKFGGEESSLIATSEDGCEDA